MVVRKRGPTAAAARKSPARKSPARTGAAPRARAGGAAAHRARFQPPRRRGHAGAARGPAAARIGAILALLDRGYPDADCALNHENPLHLLVATILSAQCTDARVNMVTPALFARYRTPRDYADADVGELEALIRSTGFYHNKAKNLVGMGRVLTDRFGGEIPRTMEEMLALPGVARKTANVVLGTAYGIASGVVVDTHVGRISQRLGLTKHEDPVRIEQDLKRLIPVPHWIRFSHQLILHGRAVCDARKPRCAECALRELCPSSTTA